jgi:hypothetical protein
MKSTRLKAGVLTLHMEIKRPSSIFQPNFRSLTGISAAINPTFHHYAVVNKNSALQPIPQRRKPAQPQRRDDPSADPADDHRRHDADQRRQRPRFKFAQFIGCADKHRVTAEIRPRMASGV